MSERYRHQNRNRLNYSLPQNGTTRLNGTIHDSSAHGRATPAVFRAMIMAISIRLLFLILGFQSLVTLSVSPCSAADAGTSVNQYSVSLLNTSSISTPVAAPAVDDPAHFRRDESQPLLIETPGRVVEQSTPQCPGFWIVSTHQSPQVFDRSCPQFRPGVTRYEQCSGYRQSSFPELCSSLIPGIPICVVVHGSFVDWESLCNESRWAWQWLRQGCPDRPLQVIFFTWPSYRPYTPLVQIDIGVLGRRAARNGFYLTDLMLNLPPESPVCLLGHSHGTRVIASSLHLMGGGSVENLRHGAGQQHGRRIRAVFAASAIDHDWLNPDERYGCALRSAECVLNLQNSLDPCLAIYPLRRPLSSRALGHSGFTRKDYSKLQGWSWKVKNLDVSGVIGVGHLWPNYFCKPPISRSISGYVYFPDQPLPSNNLN